VILERVIFAQGELTRPQRAIFGASRRVPSNNERVFEALSPLNALSTPSVPLSPPLRRPNEIRFFAIIIVA
jgi:hypothetical protein